MADDLDLAMLKSVSGGAGQRSADTTAYHIDVVDLDVSHFENTPVALVSHSPTAVCVADHGNPVLEQQNNLARVFFDSTNHAGNHIGIDPGKGNAHAGITGASAGVASPTVEFDHSVRIGGVPVDGHMDIGASAQAVASVGPTGVSAIAQTSIDAHQDVTIHAGHGVDVQIGAHEDATAFATGKAGVTWENGAPALVAKAEVGFSVSATEHVSVGNSHGSGTLEVGAAEIVKAGAEAHLGPSGLSAGTFAGSAEQVNAAVGGAIAGVGSAKVGGTASMGDVGFDMKIGGGYHDHELHIGVAGKLAAEVGIGLNFDVNINTRPFETAGLAVGHEAVHVADETAHAAVHAEHAVAHTAEHAAHAATHVADHVSHAAQHAAHSVAHAAHHVGHSIKHAFSHLHHHHHHHHHKK